MRYCVVLFVLWITSEVSTQTFEDVAPADIMRADVRFLKRNNLSNMMRLGKRGSSAKRRELGEDWSLGNLMRLGRR
ncbi:hypothetical protein Q1695_006246 [Nippostrongylus brasiliensis]|nr:hypothetical protein Q1695_006246 [Nippostrongylus brasiliensis]